MSGQNLRNFNILYININSLMNKLDEIKDEIERFEEQNDQILHFIALTETKLHISEVQDYKITHYKSFFKSNPDAYGGVALYVHRSLRCSELISQNSKNVNMLVVRIPSLSINIGVMYKPPSVNNSTFFPILKCDADKNGTIIVGDMNIDISQSNRHLEYRDIIEEHEFKILNKTAATRIGTTSRTIIDHVLTNCEDLRHKVSIGNTSFSDHRKIHITFD